VNEGKLNPVGAFILVKPVSLDNHTTESNVELIDNTFQIVEVVENSTQFKDIYKEGDKLKITQSVGHLQMYKGERHLWINGNGYPENGGHVWAIVTEE